MKKTDIDLFKSIKSSNMLPNNEILNNMREYAIEHEVPIIKDEGLLFLMDIIKIKRPTKILEIGTAIGYSASYMALATNSNVYTIERDNAMYEIAKENISKLGLNDNINIIFGDALEQFDTLKDNKFDLIFIDAAKAQYKKFFELYEPLLNDNGLIVCDNMLFHGLTEENTDTMSRSLRGLVRKLNDFKSYLENNDKYDTTLYDIGDGMSISILR